MSGRRRGNNSGPGQSGPKPGSGGLLRSLNRLLVQHKHLDAKGTRTISYVTQAERRQKIEAGLRTLKKLGYELRDVHSFRNKHLRALCRHWEAQGLKAATLQTYFSYFAVFARWIGKESMLEERSSYFRNPDVFARSYVATEDKSPRGRDIDLPKLFAEAEALHPNFAVSLHLQALFGLRFEESVKIRAREAVDRGYVLAVRWGTKGGRHRVVPVETEAQRAALARACELANRQSGSLIPNGYRYIGWKRHCYHLCTKIGLTRGQLGVTMHGLRHGYLNEQYRKLAGQLSPVQGGTGEGLTREADRNARLTVAEHAGHSREQVTTAYLGAIRTGKWRKSPETSEGA